MAEIKLVPQAVDLQLYSGDGAKFTVTVTDPAGVAIDLTGDITASIRQDRSKPVDADFAIDASEAAGGILRLSLTGAQTGGLLGDTPGVKFVGAWDCQWVPPADEPRTLVQGKVTCIPDVTRAG